MFTGTGATNATVTSTLDTPQPGSYVLNIKGSATVPTSFTKVLGQTEINISAKAEAVWGIKKLNLAPAKATDRDKVIVLLTDGENTQNRWTTSTSSIDWRTEKVCANAKADNVKIYAVRVINGDASLIKGCATKPSMYYNVQEADQLAAFGSMAQNLANLRLSK